MEPLQADLSSRGNLQDRARDEAESGQPCYQREIELLMVAVEGKVDEDVVALWTQRPAHPPRPASALALSFDRPASAGCYASWHPTILGNLGDNFLDASDGRGRQAKLLRCTLDRWARYPGTKRRRLTHKLSKPERVLSVKDSLSASSAVPSAAR